MKNAYRALAAAGILAVAGAAAEAATFNLADRTRAATSSFSMSDDGITMTVRGSNAGHYTSVSTHRGYGLSVEGHMIDGANGTEYAILGFDRDVTLGGFYAGYVDRYDQYRVYGYGPSGWQQLQYGHLGRGNGSNSSRAFVSMYGSAAAYASRFFAIGTTDRGDDFKIRSLTVDAVSEVPLPAAGLMLLTALGALGFRRRKA